MIKAGLRLKRSVKKSKRDRVPQGYFEVLPWPQVKGPPVNQLRLEANRFCQKQELLTCHSTQQMFNPMQHANCSKDTQHIGPMGKQHDMSKAQDAKMVISIGASFVGWTEDSNAQSSKAKSCLKRIARGFDPQLWVVNRGDVVDFVRADVQPAGLLLVGTSP